MRISKKSTGKFTTDRKEIFEGDYIEATEIGSKYPLKIGGIVKYDSIQKKWLNLDFDDEYMKFILKKLKAPSKGMSKLITETL